MSEEMLNEFEELARPLMEWLGKERFCPHYDAVITKDGAKLVCTHGYVPRNKTE